MLRKHYFSFNGQEVDYNKSYVEDDNGLLKTVNQSHKLEQAVPTSFTYDPLFFDANGTKVKTVQKSEEQLIDENSMNHLSELATRKINKCLTEIKHGIRKEISKSDASRLSDSELFSFVMNNPSYSYDESVKDRFESINEKFKII